MCAITKFWRVRSELTSLSLPCYALAQEENVAATLRFVVVFAHSDFCDVLIGWSCSGNWQLGTVHQTLIGKWYRVTQGLQFSRKRTQLAVSCFLTTLISKPTVHRFARWRRKLSGKRFTDTVQFPEGRRSAAWDTSLQSVRNWKAYNCQSLTEWPILSISTQGNQGNPVHDPGHWTQEPCVVSDKERKAVAINRFPYILPALLMLGDKSVSRFRCTSTNQTCITEEEEEDDDANIKNIKIITII